MCFKQLLSQNISLCNLILFLCPSTTLDIKLPALPAGEGSVRVWRPQLIPQTNLAEVAGWSVLPIMNDTSNHITSCVSGDIMKNFAPFLKLYTEYVKNFDSAMNIISALAAKSQRFAAIMDEIHVSYWLCLLWKMHMLILFWV